MRLFVALALFIPGLLLLATPNLLPLGLMMMAGGWWVYERSSLPDRDGLATAALTLSTLGALAAIVQFALQRLP